MSYTPIARRNKVSVCDGYTPVVERQPIAEKFLTPEEVKANQNFQNIQALKSGKFAGQGISSTKPETFVKTGGPTELEKKLGVVKKPTSFLQSPLIKAFTDPKVFGGRQDNVLYSTRGYSQEDITEAEPTVLEKLTAVPKVASEITNALGVITSIIPGYSTILERLANTSIGNKLADIGANIESFSKPKTPGEAKAMSVADIAINIPAEGAFAGSLKSTQRVAKIIAEDRKSVV